MDDSNQPTFRYVPGVLLGQLSALRTTAADITRAVAEVHEGCPAPTEGQAAPFGVHTGKVALCAAPVLDKYKKTLAAAVPFSGTDLCADEAALAAATDIKALADFIGQQSGELVTIYRGRLGQRTRDVVTLFRNLLENPFLDKALRPELITDCRPLFSQIETYKSGVATKRTKGIELHGELGAAKEMNVQLQEENELLREGVAPLRATVARPAIEAAPKKARRSRR